LGVSQKSLTRVLGLGTLAFGVLGVVRPASLARMMDAEEEHARAIGYRDLGSGLALLWSADPRPPIVQRMLYDVGDALYLASRKPAAAAAAAALGFAALCAVALFSD
jgi:hypothetical protein